jgi:formylglycine-generating enzyme required for sulfatase activity
MLPRAFPSGEWVHLELRAIGQEFTVSVDGQNLGTVTSKLLGKAGGVSFFAADGYFRDVVYVPLDKAAAAAASTTSAATAPAATTPAATKEAPFTNTLGMKFVPVPGTNILMCVHETRVQDFEAFVKSTGRAWSKPALKQGPTHPALGVSWEDARAFCDWITQGERKIGKIGPNQTFRLPTDHEWSVAVGIGDREDAARTPGDKDGQLKDVFPWGSAWPPPPAAGNFGGGADFPESAPVGSFPADRLGLYDLGGNAFEWCEDWMDPSRQYRVLRGGSWSNADREHLLSSNRTRGLPGARENNLGFRCVLASP